LRTDHEVMLVYAGTSGYLDKVAISQIDRWQREFLRYMDTSRPEVGLVIRETGAWNDKIENDIKQGLEDFNATWSNEEA
jgi:F-type H+-transporting ATPase subunit alpha